MLHNDVTIFRATMGSYSRQKKKHIGQSGYKKVISTAFNRSSQQNKAVRHDGTNIKSQNQVSHVLQGKYLLIKSNYNTPVLFYTGVIITASATRSSDLKSMITKSMQRHTQAGNRTQDVSVKSCRMTALHVNNKEKRYKERQTEYEAITLA